MNRVQFVLFAYSVRTVYLFTAFKEIQKNDLYMRTKRARAASNIFAKPSKLFPVRFKARIKRFDFIKPAYVVMKKRKAVAVYVKSAHFCCVKVINKYCVRGRRSRRHNGESGNYNSLKLFLNIHFLRMQCFL